MAGLTTSLYIASSEGWSGKSAVALGFLDQLSRRVGRVGVFRPILRSPRAEDDHVLDLMLSRLETGADAAAPLTAQEAAGVFYDDVHHDPEAAMSTIVDRYYAVAHRFEAMLVIGSDYTDVASPAEFSFNARIAANLDSPMVLVVSSHGQTPEQVRDRGRPRGRGGPAPPRLGRRRRRQPGRAGEHGAHRWRPCRTWPAASPRLRVPADPVLGSPTVRELVTAVGGELVYGEDALLDRESRGLLVAAMTMPNVLERLFDGCVVVCPPDRADVLLGLLLAHPAKTFPTPSGVVLNGGLELPPAVARLMEGLDIQVPLVTSPGGTMRTAADLYSVNARLLRTATHKIEIALDLFEKHVDGAGLLDRLDLSDTRGGHAADVRAPAARPGPGRGAAHRAARGRGAAHPARRRPAAAPPGRAPHPAGQPGRHPGQGVAARPRHLGGHARRPARRAAALPLRGRVRRGCGRTRASPPSRRGTSSSTRATSAR